MIRLQNVLRIPTKSSTPSEHQYPFPTLVDDVLIKITSHLSSPDIWALTLVSRRYNALTTPFLYSEIRLLWTGDTDTVSAREDRLDKKRVRKAQKRLRETLAAHTNYMLHIKTLAWHLDKHDKDSDFIKFITPMTRLQTLHVVRPYRFFVDHSPTTTPPIFLPACTRVIIEGLTTLELIQHVIRPNQLKELTVDTATYWVVPILPWILTTPFPHLTTLCLRGPGGPWIPGAGETDLVRRWTKLIFSLRAVLEEVTIGVRMAWLYPRWTSSRDPKAQPSTRTLINILWPVFLHCEFPRLRTLTLTGVKIGSGENHLIPSRHMRRIRSVVPSVILVDDTPPADKLWQPVYRNLTLEELESLLISG